MRERENAKTQKKTRKTDRKKERKDIGKKHIKATERERDFAQYR